MLIATVNSIEIYKATAVFVFLNPLPTPGIPHGAPLGRRTRPAAAHAAPEVPW